MVAGTTFHSIHLSNQPIIDNHASGIRSLLWLTLDSMLHSSEVQVIIPSEGQRGRVWLQSRAVAEDPQPKPG